MTRSAHAINAADARMDRDSAKRCEAEQDALMAQMVASTLNALLGGLTPARATKTALALADGALDRHKELTDGPCTAAWIGKKAGQLCGDIPAPKFSRQASAHAQFDRLTRPANDGEGA